MTNVTSRNLIAGFVILLNLGFFISDGFAADPSSPKPLKKWTFMLYMAADNNLEASADGDLNELETVGSNNQLNIVVQLDRNGKFSQDSEMKWSGSRRFFIEKDEDPKKFSSPMLGDLGKVDMAAPDSLTGFVAWAAKNYPAQRYALIIWNHGTGWKEIQPQMDISSSEAISPDLEVALGAISYNISYDDTSGTSMDIPTLGTTMGKIAGILGKPLDLLGFDACLMQMAEVGFEVAPYAIAQVGSPDLEPERGWPYDLISQGLAKNLNMDGKKLGATIVSSYKASYANGSQGNTAVVISLLDLTRMEEFGRAMDVLADSLKDAIEEIDSIDQAREDSLKYVYKDYADLGHYLVLLHSKVKSAAVKKAVVGVLSFLEGSGENKLVLANGHAGEKYQESRGMAIYLPDRSGFRTYKNRYKLLSMSKKCGWFSFLQEFETPALPYIRIQEIQLEDENRDGRFAPGEAVTVRLLLKNLGSKPATKATMSLSVSSPNIVDGKMAQEILQLPKPGSEKIVTAFKIQIKPDAALNSEIPLEITLSGPKIPVSNARTSFYVKSPFQSAGKVLLVITDGFSPAAPILQAMLRDNQATFDIWDRSLDGNLKPDVLKRYGEGWVLVSVQDSSDQQQLAPEEVAALSGFAKTGGRIVLSGQDLAFSLRDTSFLKDVVKVQFIQDDTNVHVVAGKEGFAGGATYQIYGGDGANNQKWPDEIDALSGATTIMKFDEGARDLANDDDMNGPNLRPSSLSRGIKSTGSAGVKVVDGYRLMFFSFGIEAVNSLPQRNALIKDILAFMNPETGRQIRDLSTASRRRTVNRPRTTHALLENVELVNNLQTRILKEIRQKSESDPQAAARALQQVQLLPQENRSAIADFERNLQSMVKFQETQENPPLR